MGIYLHEKHGLNPALYQCYLCGEDIGLILPGAKIQRFKNAGLADESGEMNRRIGAINEEPCDKCKEYMSQGIIFISTKDNDRDYRTGGWCVVKESALEHMGIHEELLKSIYEKRVCFIQDTIYDRLGLPRGEIDAEIN